MIHVINVKNPFNVREKTDSYAPVTGGSVSSYHIPAGGAYHYAINGNPVTAEAVPVDGDEIVIMPYVGKKAFSWILTIGLTVALGMITGGAGFAAGWSIGVRLGVGLAVSVLGGMLTNKLTPVPKIDMSNTEQSNTYGWGGAQTVTGQGYVLPTLYGRMKTGGIMLQRHVISDGDKQYLNVLYCLAEGPIDSITDIKLNGNPIENYSGVSIEKRYGTNHQEVIKNFNDSYADTVLSYELNTGSDWSHYELQGNAAEGLEITFGFPAGLYYSNDSGGMDATWVDLQAQYRLVGTGQWHSFEIPNNGRVTEKTNTAFYRVYRVTDITAGQYEVRARCSAKAGSSIRYANRVQWNSITQIIYDDFIHPGKALLGLKALATDQLSGSDPQMTCIMERNTVLVWNPEEKAYVNKPACNPAWAAYDIMHQCRDFDGTKVVFGAKAACMDYYAFEAWAQMCEDARLEFHYLFDSPLRNWDAVCYPARIARGSVFMSGTKITCVYDFASLPVQLFTVSNIKKESFKEEFLEMAQRANAVEVSFMNKDKDYERDVLTVYSDDYDTAEAVVNPTQIEIMGCTSVEQAYHFARWKLRENRYEIRTITFEAFVDAIACKLGDVILVQSDVVLWGDGGRIERVEGNVITVDRPIDTDYTDILVRSQETDQIYKTTIVSISDNQVTVTDPTGMSTDAVYAVGRAGKEPKKIKVLNIEKSHSEETRLITGVEYYDELYDPDTSVVPELPAYDNTVSPPRDLALTWEVFSANSGNIRYLINCSWINPVIPSPVRLEVSKNSGPWVLLDTLLVGTNTYRFDAEPDSVYTVRVYAVNSIGRKSSAAYATIDMAGAYSPAIKPTDLTVFTRYRELKDGVSRYDLVVRWYPDGLKARVYFKTKNVQVKEIVIPKGQPINRLGYSSAWTFSGEGVSELVIPQAIVNDTYKIAICPADNRGVYVDPDVAETIEYTVKAKTTTPNTPDEFVITFGENCVASWNEVANADIEYYEIRTDTAVGKDVGLLARTTNLFTNLPLTTRSGNLYLYAKGLLHYSAPAMLQYNKAAPPKPAAPQLTAKLGGFSLVAGAIPAGCTGMNIYINGSELVQVHTVNNVYTYTCDGGIYDVTITYTDIFGEGARSDSSCVTVKVLVDASLLAEKAITREKLEQGIQDAVDDAIQSVEDIKALQKSVGENTVAIQKTNEAITTVVTRTKKNEDDINANTQDISAVSQKADEISSAVFEEKQGGQKVSRIAQNAEGITVVATGLASVTTNLNDSTKAAKNYAAIKVMQDGIASKCTLNEATSYFQQDQTGFYIKGSLISIDGTTKIGNNVITKDTIASGAVITDKIAAGAITTDKIKAGAVTAGKLTVDAIDATGKIKANSIESSMIKGNTLNGTKIIGGEFTNDTGTFKVDKDGNITGATITSGTIAADMITQAGFAVKASVLVTAEISTSSSSTASTGAEIPIPNGYSEAQCVWGITRLANQPILQLTGRKVWYDYNAAGSGYTTANTYKARYWILGIK